MPQIVKRDSQYDEEELMEMSRSEIIDGMSDREVAFCEYYITDYNSNLSAIKAGYKPNGAKFASTKLRSKQSVIDYLAWLKIRVCTKCMISAEELVAMYAKFACYDVKDYVEIKGNRLYVKDFDKIDGQVIQEISQTNNGITVKFPDKIKAVDRLMNYMSENPYDWRRKLEERKVDIMGEKIAMEKLKAGIGQEIEDDGFIEALINASVGLEVEIEGEEEE